MNTPIGVLTLKLRVFASAKIAVNDFFKWSLRKEPVILKSVMKDFSDFTV